MKTAGTSYLEALRVVARHDADLFSGSSTLAQPLRARPGDLSRLRHAQLRPAGRTRPPTSSSWKSKYLERWQDVKGDRGFTEQGRQILHTTFGSVLTHAQLKGELFQTLREHPDTYRDILDEHFSKHLMALRGDVTSSENTIYGENVCGCNLSPLAL